MKASHGIGIAIIIGFVAFGASSFKGATSRYVDFAQARAATSRVQVMGKLDLESISIDNKTHALCFTLKDDKGGSLPVTYPNPEPGNFRQAKEVVAIGRVENGTFAAERLLVKCPSKYENKGDEHPADVPVRK